MRFGTIDRVLLFGGAPLLVATVKLLRTRDVDVRVYTSSRHAAEPLDAAGQTLANQLDKLGQPFVVCDDINVEPTLSGAIHERSLGIGMGEAWSFSPALIAQFGGRLLDFMGIPHPRYRGGAHYTWMIMRGERRMGLNLQVINAEMVQGEHDSGEIVKSGSYELPASARTPQDYFDQAVPHETAFIAEFLDEVQRGHDFAAARPDEARSLFLPRLHTPSHGWVDWSWSGQDIERFICAFDDPYRGASTWLGDQEVQLKGARLVVDEGPFHPFQSGLVTRVHDGDVLVATTAGHLAIARVLTAGQPVSVQPGSRFHSPADRLDAARLVVARYGTGVQR